MKKIFRCKLLSMLLALTLLFAGAVSLKPTQKANADDVYWAGYWQSVLQDLELDSSGGHICFIINKDLLMCENPHLDITTSTTIEDLNDMKFFQEMARCLGEKMGPLYAGDEIFDTTEVFSEINMDIVLRINTGTIQPHLSVNILTGESRGVYLPEHLEAITSTDEDSTIYGLGYVIEHNAFYTLLSNLYNRGNYARYSYHASRVDYNSNGLPFTIEPIPAPPQNY